MPLGPRGLVAHARARLDSPTLRRALFERALRHDDVQRVLFDVTLTSRGAMRIDAGRNERPRARRRAPSAHDQCARNGWYGDGTCDAGLCALPDPDCAAPADVALARCIEAQVRHALARSAAHVDTERHIELDLRFRPRASPAPPPTPATTTLAIAREALRGPATPKLALPCR